MVLPSVFFWTVRLIEVSPLSRASVCAVSYVSDTVATSLSRSGVPLGWTAIIVSPIVSVSVNSPIVRTMNSMFPSSIVPAGRFKLLVLSAFMTAASGT